MEKTTAKKKRKPTKGFQALAKYTAKKKNPKTGKPYGKKVAGKIFGKVLKSMKASGKITQAQINRRRRR